MGGMPTPPPTSKRARSLRVRTEGLADGSQHADRIAGAAAAQRAQSGADDLVENLDPAFFARSPAGSTSGRRMGTSGSQVRCTKLPGSARAAHLGAAMRRTNCSPGQAVLRNDQSVFETDAAAMRGMHAVAAAGFFVRQCGAHLRPSITASSTAMRTATPLRTWSRITDCGPSATSEAISMPRFMGCGCMTMASGLALASRSADRPNFAK